MAEIVLDFQSFDMESDPSAPVGAVCRFDYLEIWDGYHTGRDEKKKLRVKTVLTFRLHAESSRKFIKSSGPNTLTAKFFSFL